MDPNLILKAQFGDKILTESERSKIETARTEVVKDMHSLVHKIAQKYRYRAVYVTYEELYQEGMCGVLIAIEKYKVDFNVKFSTYAVWWIRQRMQRIMLVKNQPVIRCKNPKGQNVKFEAFFEKDLAERTSSKNLELEMLLESALKCLPGREREIIRLRFYKQLTLREIAISLKISRERVRQIEMRALKRLFKFFGEKGCKHYEDFQ